MTTTGTDHRTQTQLAITGTGAAFLSLVLVATAAGIPIEYLITSNTGYRAVLPACVCERTACLGCRASGISHCHGGFGHGHELHARALLAKVAKTYGSAKRRETAPPTDRRPRPKMSEAEWRAARGEITWDEAYAAS